MADNFRYVQAQPFSLAGSGAIIGATSITLKSFAGIDGILLTMTNFGTLGTGTLQPGEGVSEESISFTGVVQNANGTATLTGVKSEDFLQPGSSTVGLLKTHPGSCVFIVSNTSKFYDKLTSKDDDETITATWTFTNPNYPRMNTATPAPTDDEQLAPKKYVDDVVIAGGADASATVKGISKLSLNPVSPTNPIAVGDNDTRVPTQGENDALVGDNTDIAVGTGNKFVTQTGLQKQTECYAATSTGNDTYVIALSPIPISYTNGMTIRFKVDVANTGAATLDVNGLGAISIVKGISSPLTTGDIVANQIIEVIYNSTGTVFQMNTPSSNSITYTGTFKNGVTTRTGDASSGSQTIAHGLGRVPLFIRMTAYKAYGPGSSTTYNSGSNGVFNGTTTSCVFFLQQNNTGQVVSGNSTSNIIEITDATDLSVLNAATVAVDATNITLTWTLTGSPNAATINILWEAQA